MSLELTWITENALDRVADVRLRCFGAGTKDRQRFVDITRSGIEPPPREFLVAHMDGEDVGTVTSINLTMWIRGASLACQGVGYVGTAKTHRRGGAGEKGLASQMMWQTVEKAREQGKIVSALMPFRASFYEHFGYGLIEKRNEWTVPTAVFPQGSFAGFRFFRDEDLPMLLASRNAAARTGQCDVERSECVWRAVIKRAEDGFIFIDRPDPTGPVHSWMILTPEQLNNRPCIRITNMGHDSPAAFQRQLYFLSSLQDQHQLAILSLPSDLPLNWLLRESLVPLSPGGRSASLKTNTRMQLKILDHARFLEMIHWPAEARGSAVIRIAEANGQTPTYRIDVEAGHATVKPASNTATFECPERIWAAIATGEITATSAARLGLANAEPPAARLLDSLSDGRKPYCGEYF